ncbi:tRNA (N6-threonylcarbamoyladenosine(37)-N6)-methyltransferase TrmO [Desulfovibrio sulfodismutans]|uniref:tRNA (N6-threonylcarbamoyladenosine(37)-N6)-methyltransferase TrmO n=1 Tax=Desulfolutivibrio sulfodismutans TaxID=63561 RepID=A0A7K3NJA5_9BACT|nr:tRNA (N6-threonylcarbamoyladenosine(37)-N6)-methyltransferase TrmO [Desulfolutivibrio sulfodismutans]NDY56250.1 tRNA (N6-threonylcarbamoyladenosine(37)-N6)-methyltransferase TrmO [Desulfolutivibrio sulfodismutans]QLA11307.1 tRNA (N6-threonylcarbamoyladenosine(37)-N6)-methyltransferase TrmO [Desulfolutivibrio sulfodismutans DSM 3696]
MPQIVYQPIGIVHTPFHSVRGMPIQPVGAIGVVGRLEVYPEFEEGLRDLDGFSHVIMLYHLHKIQGHALSVRPFLDTSERGIFATRSPRRPNPIGISVLRVLSVAGNMVELENVDMLDQTPVLDIKPYVADFDVWDADRFGWFDGVSGNAVRVRSDGRFESAPSCE